MPSVATANAKGTKNKSRILRRMLNLSQVEQQAKFNYITMDLMMFEHAYNESWTDLASQAKQGRGYALTTLARLKGMSKITQKMPDEASDMRKTLSDPQFREALEEFITASGKDSSSIDRYLDKGNLKIIANGPQALIHRTLNEQGAYAIATGFKGYWAGFFAEFNLACQKGDMVRFYTNDDFAAIEDFVAEQDDALWTYLDQIKELLSEQTPDIIHKECMAILLELEGYLVWLPNLAAKIYLALDQALLDKDANLISELVVMDSNIGILARSWAFTTAVALYAAQTSTLHEEDKAFKDLKKKSQNLPFESKVPYGEITTLHELVENGQAYHSKMVEVSGFVRNIKVSRAGGVYRTEFTLTDIEGAHQVQVIAVYENLAHQGMIDSSYAHLSGTWDMDSKLAKYPIIQVSRLTLSTYNKESWLDYMTTAVRPWFDLYPNSHNLVWSVRPECKGGIAADESTKTGAGEIYFNKTFRYKGGN